MELVLEVACLVTVEEAASVRGNALLTGSVDCRVGSASVVLLSESRAQCDVEAKSLGRQHRDNLNKSL
jgi:hypothetical protein